MRRGNLRRECRRVEAVVLENGSACVALPALDLDSGCAGGVEIGARGRVRRDEAGLRAELRGHVAQGHAFLHRERRDGVPRVLHRLVLAAVHAEARAQEEDQVLGDHTAPELSAPLDQDGVRHREPDFARHQNAEHFRGADAEHVGAERAAGGRVAVAADREQARPEVPFLGEHDVADADAVVEFLDAGLLHPFARDADDVPALLVVRRKVVVGDDDDLLRIPDFRAEPLEHGLDAPRTAGVVHHREVHPAGDDLAGSHGVAAGGPGDDLLREGLQHGQIPR